MILLVAAAFFLVSFGAGFGAGWYVRGAYPARRLRAPGWRETYADHRCADCGARASCAERARSTTVLVCDRWIPE